MQKSPLKGFLFFKINLYLRLMRPETNFFTSGQWEEKFYWTVKEVSQRIKGLLDNNFPYLWIEGEISSLRHSQNGNLYLNLVDEEASLKGIIFRDQREFIASELLREGLKVLTYGKLTLFPRSGEVFFIIRKLEPLGIGLLQLRKEFLLQKYKPFFSPEVKKGLPPFPKKVALITSLFGAALQDFLKVSQARWGAHILLYPVKVQGEGAHLEISKAIEDLNTYFPDLDLIVITRGGGSTEDLAPFYTEELILSIFDSRIPIVSAVGHEIDLTLCDLAADKRSPTPSAAAQEIFPDKRELLERLEILKKKLHHLFDLKLTTSEGILKSYQVSLQEKNPVLLFSKTEKLLRDFSFSLYQKVNSLLQRKEGLLLSLQRRLESNDPEKKIALQEEKLRGLKKLLFSLSPYNILEKGYSIVKILPDGKIIKSATEVMTGNSIEITLAEGKIYAEVIKVKK